MSDPFDPSPPPADPAPADEAFAWDADYADDPDAARERHDAFNKARKRDFLKALVKTGCLADACRLTGVAPRTIYRHQGNDQGFLSNCAAALSMCETPVEITAWQRAVEGIEEQFVAGGHVHTRIRYSDNLLRLLLQGSNPRKYGARPGFKRKRILKHEKKQMEREILAEIAAKRPTFDESIEALEGKLEAVGATWEKEKIAAGWTRVEAEGYRNGYLIPPGYGPLPDRQGAEIASPVDSADGTPRDSMCHS